jgi:hypothetical protein
MRCPTCLAGAVETQQEARRHLPVVRGQMADIGIDLPQPVRVQVVGPDEVAAAAGVPATGVLLGVTEQVVDDREAARHADIRVVAGLPPVIFGRAVAHEMGHAWFALRGRAPAPEPVEEGLCELFAYAWLKRQPTRMAEALRQHLRSNPDPVYGGGFRQVYTAVRRYDIELVLNRILQSGQLP